MLETGVLPLLKNGRFDPLQGSTVRLICVGIPELLPWLSKELVSEIFRHAASPAATTKTHGFVSPGIKIIAVLYITGQALFQANVEVMYGSRWLIWDKL